MQLISNSASIYEFSAPKKRSIAQVLNNRTMCLILVIITGASFFFTNAFADTTSPIVLSANIVTESDGQAPAIALDPVVADTNPATLDVNGLVANNDVVTENLNFSVNTTDGKQHNLDYVIITASFPSAVSGTFSEGTVSPSCLGVLPGGGSISTDGKTLKCKVMGPFPIGNAVQINVGWIPSAKTPNNTDISVQYTLEGVMTPDADYPTPINPTTVSSNIATTKAVSTTSGVDMMKKAGNPIYNRDSNGSLQSITFQWGITFGLTNPSMGISKGMDPSALGKISAQDNISTLGAPWQNATLDGCDIGRPNDGAPVPHGAPYFSGNRGYVKNAGVFTCSQTGGPGSNISIENTGVDYDAQYFPFGYVNSTPAEYFGMNQGGRTNEIYKQTTTTNYHAVVSGGYVKTTIPFSDLLAFDNTPGDKAPGLGVVRVCNTASNLQVVGADPTGADPISDNTDCVDIITGAGSGATKAFSLGGSSRTNSTNIDAILGSSASAYGAKNGTDNIVVPGEKLFSALEYTVDMRAPNAISGIEMCDAIDNNNIVLTDTSFYTSLNTPQSTYNTFALDNFVVNQYSAIKITTVQAVPGFVSPTEADVAVEFASVAPMTTSSALTDADCSNPSITWQSNPNLVAGGITKANLIRVRLNSGKSLPPGKRIEVSIPMQVRADKQPGDIVQNAAQYKAGAATNWIRGYDCNLYDWTKVNTIWALCDRAIVIAPTGHIEVTDNTDPTAAGGNHGQSETMKTVVAGQPWYFDIRGDVTYNTNINIKNVQIYTVLPEGIRYDSANIAPSKIIGDCDASINFGCITDNNLRTNAGSTTLIWDRGDIDFIVPSANLLSNPYTASDLLGFIKVKTKTDISFSNTVKRQVKTWVTSTSGMNGPVSAFPQTEGPWGGYYDNRSNGQYDDDWITFSTIRSFSITKNVYNELVPINGKGSYDIAYSNTSSDDQKFDFIDVLPYNGDARVPRVSEFTGGYSLDAVNLTKASGVSKVYITDASPDSINKDPSHTSNSLTSPNTIWKCTYDQVGTTGCPAANQITAIRIFTNDLVPNTREVVRITLTLNDNIGKGFYANQASGNPSKIANTLIWSENVFFRTPFYSVGDLVFEDKNNNGTFDTGDSGIEGVDVKLMSGGPDATFNTSDDVVVDIDTTDSDGRYRMNATAAGDYYVLISSDQFASGKKLFKHVVQTDGVSNVNNDKDEDVNHNGIFDASSGSVRSNVFNLSDDNEPLNEPNSTSGWDKAENLTIDFGFIAPVKIGNYTWKDSNYNGKQDAGENPIAGVTVGATWFGPDDTFGTGDDVVYSDISDANGKWELSVQPGKYRITFSQPVGYGYTKSELGADREKDSSGATLDTTVLAYTDDFSFDTGYVQLGTIGDTVFHDRNQNKKQDTNDEGFSNVDVTLTFAGADGFFGNSDDQSFVTKTDANGKYLFENLAPGKYRVSVDTDDLPTDIRILSSDTDGADTPSISELDLAANSSNLDQDFSYYSLSDVPVTTTTTTLPTTTTTAQPSTTTTQPVVVKGNTIEKIFGQLPFTGNSSALINLAMLILITGLLVFAVMRKRRRHP